MKEINNIEQLIKTKQKKPILTLKLLKDICKRIKKLEARK